LTSVEGVKVVTGPSVGKNAQAQTVVVVELGGKATLSGLTKALEEAATPHKAACPPGVAAILSGKAKAGVTPEQIDEALKKAGITE
jgi:hypothetical protein